MSFPAGPQPAKNAQEFAISASKTTPRLPSLTADLGQKGDNCLLPANEVYGEGEIIRWSGADY